jgi:uncharacterized protein (DUF433 family)
VKEVTNRFVRLVETSRAREYSLLECDCPFGDQMDRSLIVHSDPEILGGTPVFVGTRVPVQTLLVYLEKGETLEEFLDNFPTVSREQAIAFLEEAGRALLAQIA